MLSVAKHLASVRGVSSIEAKHLRLWYNQILQLAAARFRMTNVWAAARLRMTRPYAFMPVSVMPWMK